jgi:hypothetical protein
MRRGIAYLEHVSNDPHLDLLLTILDGIPLHRRVTWMQMWCPLTTAMLGVGIIFSPIRNDQQFSEYGSLHGAHRSQARSSDVHFVGAGSNSV